MFSFESVPIPKEVSNEEHVLRAFGRYLYDDLVWGAIYAEAPTDRRARAQLDIVRRELNPLAIARELHEFVERAPALKIAAGLARDVENPTILPPDVIPSPACIEACLKAHHDWKKRPAD